MNKKRSLPTASETLKSSSDMQNINYKVQQLNQLNSIISAVIPEQLKPHCQVANLRANGTLILATSSPIWKYKLKLNLESILSKLKGLAEFPPINRIEVITIPDLLKQDGNATNTEKQPRNIPCKSTIELFEQTSETTNNNKLSRAIKKLVAQWSKYRQKE